MSSDRDQRLSSEEPTIPPAKPDSESPTEAHHGEHDSQETPTVSRAASETSFPKADTTPLGTKVRYFGDYELLGEIARGGMGVVYKARQVSLNRIVALKMILSGELASEADVQRFHTEAEAAAKLDHPGIVPIHEVGLHEGQHYFSMGFVDGQSLADKLVEGPMPPKEAAELTRQLAEAIGYAHEHGVIHRDLKPANVLLAQSPESSAESPVPRKQRDASSSRGSRLSTLDSRPRITDFGLAKKMEGDSNLTGTGQILGTPSYMPPEQAAGKTNEIGPQADVYALGAVLYTMLTGRPPFQAANPMDTLLQVLDKEVVAPRQLVSGIPRNLETICLRCLQKEPQRRYRSADALAEDVQRFLRDEPIHARPVGPPVRAWLWCRRNPIVASLVAAVTTLLLILGIAGPIMAIRQTRLASEKAVLAAEEARAKETAVAEKEEAQRQRDRAERQLRVATAVRLGYQAKELREEFPVRSLLLAIEAVEATRRHREPVVALARQSLHDCLNSNHLGQSFAGHSGWITSLAISPDRRWLATASQSAVDKTARLWDLTAANPSASPKVLRGYGGNTLDISPDGRWLVSGSNAEASRLTSSSPTPRIWDLSADTQADSAIDLRGHTDPVSVTAISPDSRWLVSGSWDKTARLWDLTAADVAGSGVVLSGHEDSITDIAISPDAGWLVTASTDGAARLWDLSVSNVPASSVLLAGHTDAINGVAISPDGRWLVTVSSDQTARLWDLNAADIAASSLVLPDHEGPVELVEVSPDGRWLVTAARGLNAGKGNTRLWDLQAADVVDTAITLSTQAIPIEMLAISADSRWLATLGATDKVVKLWELAAPDVAASEIQLGPHQGPVNWLAISPDSRWLATTAFEDKAVRLWDLRASEVESSAVVLRGHDSWVATAVFGPNSQSLVTGGTDRIARLWTLDGNNSVSDASLTIFPHVADGVMGSPLLAFSPNSRWLVTDSFHLGKRMEFEKVRHARRRAQIRAGINGQKMQTERRPENKKGEQTVEPAHQLQLWDLQSGSTRPLATRLGNSFDRSAFSGNSRWLVTLDDTTLALWDLASADANQIVLSSEVSSQAAPIAISQDGHRLAASCTDNAERLWDLTAEQVAASAVTLEDVGYISFSPDGRWMASRGNALRIFDLAADDAIPTATVLRQNASFDSISFSLDGRWLFGRGVDLGERPGGDAKLWRWDLSAEKVAASSMTLCEDLPRSSNVEDTMSPDGRWFVTSGGREVGSGAPTRVRLWDLAAPNIAASAIEVGGHSGAIQSCTVSTDSRWLAVAGLRDGHVWNLQAEDVATSGVSLNLEEAPETIQLGPDGRWLATTQFRDSALLLWDLNTSDIANSAMALRGHEAMITGVAFSSDGKWLATSGRREQTPRLWDLTATNIVASALALHGHASGVDTPSFSPDGQRLVTRSTDSVRVWDVGLDAILARARRMAGRVLTDEEQRTYFLEHVEADHAEPLSAVRSIGSVKP